MISWLFLALSAAPPDAPVSLAETLHPSAIVDLGAPVRIAGRVAPGSREDVLVRVTTSLGAESRARVRAKDGVFACRYPADFPGAPSLVPCLLFIDATLDGGFDPRRPGAFQAEAALIVRDRTGHRIPDFPSAFTTDLLDRAGRVDRDSSEWPVIRALVNLYLRSRGARLAGFGRPEFDLARDEDLRFFKDHLSLYEFDHRDRDWSAPLGHRFARTFWQAVWNAWFNASNDHPIDGNEQNKAPSNFMPYTFSNDFADILIVYLLRRSVAAPLDDNLDTICREGVENLLAMQHREVSNFAILDVRGKRETYTAGAFRYGMFEDGEFLTEGKGWFHVPASLDHIQGGVFNGRAAWALGEALRRDPKSPLSSRVCDALRLALKFCLADALDLGYARRTRAGNIYWRDPGEHAYLLLGMLAAAAADPALVVPAGPGGRPVTLSEACVAALDALVDLELPHHQWQVYPDKDAMAIAALAEGAAILARHPRMAAWKASAERVADAWLAARVDPAERPGPIINFGPRISPGAMTFNWRRLSKTAADRNVIHLYITGHWIHALARLYSVTGESRFRERAEAMVRYLLGENPWNARLLTELGGVYNWVTDSDGDGVEDRLQADLYPESTAFCAMGIRALLEAIAN